MYIEVSIYIRRELHSHTGAIPTKPTIYKRVHIYIRRQDMPFAIGHTLDTQAFIHRSAKNEMGGGAGFKNVYKIVKIHKNI